MRRAAGLVVSRLENGWGGYRTEDTSCHTCNVPKAKTFCIACRSKARTADFGLPLCMMLIPRSRLYICHGLAVNVYYLAETHARSIAGGS